jgi:hypothetical protein
MLSNAYRILVWIPEGKRPFGCHGHGWEENIEVNFEELGWEGMDWFHLAKDRNK